MNIEEHLPLVHFVVQRYRDNQVHEYDDLFQVGCIGLIKAIHGFDPERGFKFSTYAVPKIQGEIWCYLRDTQPLKFTRSELPKARKLKMTSFDAILPTSGNDRGDTLSDIMPYYSDYSDPMVDGFLNELPERERDIVRYRMADMSQVEVGKRLGVSQVQVSRITQKIGQKLEQYMAV